MCSSGGGTCRQSSELSLCHSGLSPAHAEQLCSSCSTHTEKTQTHITNTFKTAFFHEYSHQIEARLCRSYFLDSRQLSDGSVQMSPHPFLTRLDDVHFLLAAQVSKEYFLAPTMFSEVAHTHIYSLCCFNVTCMRLFSTSSCTRSMDIRFSLWYKHS